jgi:predicted DCC family thiol-disulfide oxidoreductase YuxK
MNAQADSSAHHVVLYDGLCGVCNRFNRFVIDRDPRGKFLFAALQSATARNLLAPHGLVPDDLSTVYVVARESGGERVLARSDASFFVLRELGGFWSAVALLRFLPRGLRDWGYDLFARHRYRIVGRHETCPLPRPGEAARFLDV